MARRNQPVFTVEDEPDDEVQNEFSIENITSSFGDIQDLPPELRNALMSPSKPFTLAESKRHAASIREDPLDMGSYVPPVTPVVNKSSVSVREVEYEVKSSAEPPKPVASQVAPPTKLTRVPSSESRQVVQRSVSSSGGWWSSLFMGSGSGGGQQDEEEEEEGEETGTTTEEEEVVQQKKPVNVAKPIVSNNNNNNNNTTTTVQQQQPQLPKPTLQAPTTAPAPPAAPPAPTVAPSDEEDDGEYEDEDEGEEHTEEEEAQKKSGWFAGVFGGGGKKRPSEEEDTDEEEVASPPVAQKKQVQQKETPVPVSWLASLTSKMKQVTEDSATRAAEVLSNMTCSWCFKTQSRHHMIRSEWLIRPHYQCGECAALTVSCFGCKEGMARCYGDTADKMCYRCNGLFDSVQGDPTKLVCDGHKCSWCRATASQVLWRTASTVSDNRDVYTCEGCGAHTLKCEKCSNFARASEQWRDKLCVVCDGTFKDWEGALKTWVGRVGCCSWCLTQCKHELVQRSLLFRSGFRCLNCQNPTIECRKCKDNMARSTESLCVSCIQNRSWDELQAEKQSAFKAENWSPSKGMEEMGRSSREKRLAWSHGHIRPFLLLVSMRPALRSQVASCLGVALLATEAFGDSHKEAWAIISAPNGLVSQSQTSHKGILPSIMTGMSLAPSVAASTAASQQPTWYHVLRRVIDRTFGGVQEVTITPSGVMSACRHPEDKQIPALEKEALARIARFCLSTQRIESVDFTRQDKEGLHLVLGHYLKAEGGVEDDRAVLLYAWKVVLMSRGVKELTDPKQSAKKKPFPVPPDMAPLFNSVTILLNQRIMMSSEGISIEHFYECNTGSPAAEGSENKA